MNKNIIFVTGFFGAPIMQSAQRIAEEKGYALKSLDDEIEKSDGRTVRRICMVMGEHEYRNKEYETLKSLIEGPLDNIVVACGDGVLHDDMSKELICKHELVIVGYDMTCAELWEQAKNIEGSCHAFMNFGSDEDKQVAFEKLFERQRVLFAPYF
ncbi:MAG: shikimate kinase [Bacillota bacterium]|nr:shikimate kinase [Bacillota bacterium]